MRLDIVGDGAESTAAARGRLTVFLRREHLPESEPIYRGRRLRIPLRLQHAYAGAGSATGELVRQGWSTPEAKFRASLQRSLRGRLRLLGDEQADFSSALLLGVKREGVLEAAEEFRRAGTAHLLALSGMHLGVFYLSVLAVTAFLLGKRRAVCAAALAVCGYLWLVGVRPSLMRAALMCLLGTTVYLRRGKRPDALSLLGVAFIIQVLLTPQAAASLSFMLSYLALAGIVTAAGPLAGLLPYWLPPALRLPLAVGIAAQLATAPLLGAVFGRLFPGGVAATLLLAPLVTALLYLGIIFSIWSGVGPLLGSLVGPRVLWYGQELCSAGIGLIYRAARAVAGSAASFRAVTVRREAVAPLMLLCGSLLTVVLVGAYAVIAWRKRKGKNEKTIGSRLAKGDQPFLGGAQHRRNPPLWAKLSSKPGSTGEDHRAA